jgi:uncharacterized protein YegP (UPF0339 family)
MTTAPKPAVIEIYKGRKLMRQAWRWRAIAANGEILAVSSEAYTNRGDIRAIVNKLFPGYQIKEPDGPPPDLTPRQ